MEVENEPLWKSKDVRVYLNISTATQYRRENDPDLGFPRPIVINGVKYYRPSLIRAWLAERERAGRAA